MTEGARWYGVARRGLAWPHVTSSMDNGRDMTTDVGRSFSNPSLTKQLPLQRIPTPYHLRITYRPSQKPLGLDDDCLHEPALIRGRHTSRIRAWSPVSPRPDLISTQHEHAHWPIRRFPAARTSTSYRGDRPLQRVHETIVKAWRLFCAFLI